MARFAECRDDGSLRFSTPAPCCVAPGAWVGIRECTHKSPLLGKSLVDVRFTLESGRIADVSVGPNRAKSCREQMQQHEWQEPDLLDHLVSLQQEGLWDG
jgi:hypothetical protein